MESRPSKLNFAVRAAALTATLRAPVMNVRSPSRMHRTLRLLKRTDVEASRKGEFAYLISTENAGSDGINMDYSIYMCCSGMEGCRLSFLGKGNLGKGFWFAGLNPVGLNGVGFF